MAEVMARVRHDYVDPVSDDELMNAAIRGMVAALDPHSEFLDPDEYADLKVSSSGNYSGIGIEVAITDGAIRVVAPSTVRRQPAPVFSRAMSFPASTMLLSPQTASTMPSHACAASPAAVWSCTLFAMASRASCFSR